tara:strand:- start:1482 stop:1715 length:234 start_codon:yes stop_codon:yes gene_type:complete
MKTVFGFDANEVRDRYEDLGIDRHSRGAGCYYYTIDREYHVNMSKGDFVYINGDVYIIDNKVFNLETNEIQYSLKLN